MPPPRHLAGESHDGVVADCIAPGWTNTIPRARDAVHKPAFGDGPANHTIRRAPGARANVGRLVDLSRVPV